MLQPLPAPQLDKAMEIIRKWWVIPEIKIISQFWDDEGYINSFVEKGKKYDVNDYDHVLFSYHGLPERQVDKVYDDAKPCSEHNCENEITEENKYCYKAPVLWYYQGSCRKIKYSRR